MSPSRQTYQQVSTLLQDPILERRTCSITGSEFPIYQSDKDFLEKISPTFAGKRFLLSLPKVFYQERLRTIMVQRNERKLYKKKSCITDKELICVFDPASPYKTCEYDIRHSEAVDNKSVGIDFDESMWFALQLNRLVKQAILRPLLRTVDCENCQYNNYVAHSKNCYMCFSCVISENCVYSYYCDNCEYCYECMHTENCKYCFNVLHGMHCYKCFASRNMESCTECYNSSNLRNCSYCIDCHDLEDKKYCIKNQAVSQEIFEQALWEIEIKALPSLVGRNMKQEIILSEKCLGNAIHESSRCKFGYLLYKHCEQVSYSSRIVSCSNIMDSYGELASEYIYSSVTCTAGGYMIGFSAFCYPSCQRLRYCYDCLNCQDCFWCVGLKDSQFCILNKQYSKAEYELQVAKIIQDLESRSEWGKLLIQSPFWYNDTIAQDYYPLERQEALEQWFSRQDNHYDPSIWIQATIAWDHIPNIHKVDDSILQAIILCKETQRPFRISKTELDFYRKHHIDLPQIHPDIRHQIRLSYKMYDGAVLSNSSN